MVTRRYISKNQAYEIGKRILWDNPLEFFGARVRA
jgi:hypothetical protein